MPKDAVTYHGLRAVARAERRRFLVRLAFGTQSEAARQYGVHQTTVSQIVGLKRRSRPLEKFLLERIQKKLPPRIANLWAA